MKFWEKLFRRKKVNEDLTEDENWEEIVYSRETVDFTNEEQRSRYVMDCLEQVAEASRETELLTGEYEQVTSYLVDMEEIESLPPLEKQEIEDVARQLQRLSGEKVRYRERKSRMSDSDFHHIKNMEKEVEEGIRKIKNEERQNALIKQDLVRLDRERQAFDYRRKELGEMQNNMRGATMIILVAIIVLVVILLAFQIFLEMETSVGYFMAVLVGSISLTIIYVKGSDAQKESKRVAASINKLIQLQNKIKIRYVNNVNLLDYLYLKYNTDSASKLEKMWENYSVEKREREQYMDTEEQLEENQARLLTLLKRYRVQDPMRWLDQVEALLDSREMVEIRHELILRRQALRKQMDYNSSVAKNAHGEIMDLVEIYPQYAKEILEMAEKYKYE